MKALNDDKPVYTIGVMAELLSVHPRTLRIYEEEGLIKPFRRGNRRFFSNNDLRWIRCIRDLIHKEGISIPGIKRLLTLAPCWEIKRCPEEVRQSCSAYRNRSKPCWELVSWACGKGVDRCQTCEVYLSSLKKWGV